MNRYLQHNHLHTSQGRLPEKACKEAGADMAKPSQQACVSTKRAENLQEHLLMGSVQRICQLGKHWAKAAKLTLESTSTYSKGTWLSHTDLLSTMQAQVKHLLFWNKSAGRGVFLLKLSGYAINTAYLALPFTQGRHRTDSQCLGAAEPFVPAEIPLCCTGHSIT